jgi:hypothetical protein
MRLASSKAAGLEKEHVPCSAGETPAIQQGGGIESEQFQCSAGETPAIQQGGGIERL